MCRAVHPWKISEFLHRGFASPKKLPRARYFGWGACYQRTAQAAQFRAIEIISGAVDNSQGCAFCIPYTAQFRAIEIISGLSTIPKDVPFVHIAQFRAIEIISGAVDNCQGCAFCMWVLMEDVHSGVAMGWAGRSKSRGPRVQGPQVPDQKLK